MRFLLRIFRKIWNWLFWREPAIEFKIKTTICSFNYEDIENLIIVKRHKNGRIYYCKEEKENNMIKLKPTQFVDVFAVPLDRHGRPAKIEKGSAVWSVAGLDETGNPSDSVLRFEVSENELRGRLFSGEGFGTGVLTLKADGDSSEDTLPIVGTVSVQVNPENVVSLELKTSSEAQDQEVDVPDNSPTEPMTPVSPESPVEEVSDTEVSVDTSDVEPLNEPSDENPTIEEPEDEQVDPTGND